VVLGHQIATRGLHAPAYPLGSFTLFGMDGVMAEVCGALGEQHAELWGLVGDLDDESWHLPSRCEGWDVADVVLHMAQTDEAAVASLDGSLGADAGDVATGADARPTFAAAVAELGPTATADDSAAWMVEQQRGAPGPEVARRWRRATDQLRARLAGDDPHRRVPWVAGDLSTVTLATTRLAECWIHTGDVADALGVDLVAGDRLRHVARLAWRTLPYAFARAGRGLRGPVAFRLQGPAGDSWTFEPDAEPVTVVEGDGVELCLVAARRVDPAATALHATGPDAAGVLELVRTYA
jgi:uncharacterized protein (TIGR03084 family)